MSYIIGTRDKKYLSIRLKELIFTKNINLASVFSTLEELNEFELEYGNEYSELTYPFEIKKGEEGECVAIEVEG